MSREADPMRRMLAPRKRESKPLRLLRRSPPKWWWLVPLTFLALVVAMGAVRILWSPRQPPAAVVPASTAAPAPTPVTSESIPARSVAELLNASKSDGWRMARLGANPSLVVIEFPGLTEQGRAMNRLAAMYEKRAGNRDRVLSDAEMALLLRRGGDSIASFYQGHDYTGEMMARFYSLAAAQRVQLSAQELLLRTLLVEAGVLQSDGIRGYKPLGTQAVVSFTAEQQDDPATEADETVDSRRRESVLLHELSHGEYFTNAAYRAHCWDFWRTQLTEPERQLFRAYLERLDYNPDDEELMVNETQAVLMNTPDTRAFNAASLGVSEAELERLRARFLANVPPPRAANQRMR